VVWAIMPWVDMAQFSFPPSPPMLSGHRVSTELREITSHCSVSSDHLWTYHQWLLFLQDDKQHCTTAAKIILCTLARARNIMTNWRTIYTLSDSTEESLS
jgi:phage terminase large subunit